MLKILQVKLQQHMNHELTDVQAGFRKDRGTRDQIANICWIIKKSKRVPEKHLLLLLWLRESLGCVAHNKLWKILQETGIPNNIICLLKNLYASQEATVRTEHGTTDWFQIGKEYVKTVYCHPAYLTYMQSTSWETLGWMKHKLESRLPGEISITSDMQMTPPYWQKVQFSSVQSLSHVQLFATPWIAARQASLSNTNSWSSPRLTSIESVMPSSHLIFFLVPLHFLP